MLKKNNNNNNKNNKKKTPLLVEDTFLTNINIKQDVQTNKSFCKCTIVQSSAAIVQIRVQHNPNTLRITRTTCMTSSLRLLDPAPLGWGLLLCILVRVCPFAKNLKKILNRSNLFFGWKLSL